MSDVFTFRRLVQAMVLLTATAAPAFAESGGRAIVIPGRPGVPIIINGRDASYAMIEGDWGLERGTHVQPTIYGSRRVVYPEVGHYYPGSNRLPGYGRLEIEPPPDRKLPKPAESFHQSWGAESLPPQPAPPTPMIEPQVLIAPPFDEAPRPGPRPYR
ncbi:hypothetical protein [Rhodopseudomonas parapalustris]